MLLSFAQKHFVFFPPLSFVFLHSWDLSVISQIIMELVIKKLWKKQKKPNEPLTCKRRTWLMGPPKLWVLV